MHKGRKVYLRRNRMGLDDLPVEMKQRIFQYTDIASLGQLAKTSRQFRRIAQDEMTERPVYRRDPNMDKVLTNAIKTDNLDAIKKFLKYMKLTPYTLILAIRHEHLNIVKALIESGIDPSFEDNYPLIEASRRGHADIVNLLLADPRVDLSEDGDRALSSAVSWGHTAVVRRLLADPHVNPNNDDQVVITTASENGYTDIVRMLLADDRFDPSVDNNAPIRYAAASGHTGAVKLLLADPRVNPRDVYDYALNMAKRYEYYDIVKLLQNHARRR
jgi:ankyrin repeat protein